MPGRHGTGDPVGGRSCADDFHGTIDLVGDALLEYTSGGIQSIANGAELSLSGVQARVADAGVTTTSSALAGLNSISGPAFGNPTALSLQNGAALALSGNLNNSATIRNPQRHARGRIHRSRER